MSKKIMKEWFINVPWGRLAMVSWGEPAMPPILLVHGLMDTAATFVPLVAAMPDLYHFVSFDLPGHGLSDTMPGPPVYYIHFVEAIRQIVEQMRWDSFYCIAHSMGYIISASYNAVCPGKVRRLVSLGRTAVCIGVHGVGKYHKDWFDITYNSYYLRYCPPPPPVSYTYEEAVRAVAKPRGLTQEQAAGLLTRSIAPTSDGRFRLTWDAKVKKMFSLLVSDETFYANLSVPTPTLSIEVTDDTTPIPFGDYTADMVAKLVNEQQFVVVKVPGGHNVHLTNPEFLVPHIIRFFNEDMKSKL